jgi:hypothetical protein
MKKFRRAVMWMMCNGVLLYLAFLGLLREVAWAENIVLFVVYTMTVFMCFVAYHPPTRKEIRKKGRSVPWWLSVLSDLCLLFMLVSVGRFFTGAVLVWQMMCEHGIFNTKIFPDKTENKG